MTEKKNKKFYTVGQIDATGVRGPHEKELNDISYANIEYFLEKDTEEIKTIVQEDLGGKVENIGFNEDWTVTLEFFPEANIHLTYSYYGDEFSDVEAEFRFLFSGERVHWIPGEDTATYIDIIFDFFERQFKNKKPAEKAYEIKTELMEKVLDQRKQPFKFLKAEDKEELASFIGADVSISDGTWTLKKEVFPEIYIEVSYNTSEKKLDIHYSGENLEKIGSYHIELIGIFLINHIIRYITITNQDEELPDICYMMFSRMITKEKGWTYRKMEGIRY
jgi:hypothetical protein